MFLDNVTAKYSIAEEDVVNMLSSVARTVLCNEITGAYAGYEGGIFYITNSCKRFIKIIVDKTDG